MQRFIADGLLPHFHRMYAESHVFTTDAQEKPPNLEPWIQWVTVHAGLPFREHGIFHLGHGDQLEAPRLWDVFSASGLRVWVCGSMNAGYEPPFKGHFLPDPWSNGTRPYPDELLPYFRFVQKHVQEHTTGSVPLSLADYVDFVRFMASHGLSPSTAATATRQLLAERMVDRRWMRPVILDKLQFDLFAWYYRRFRPHFSTFFLNSTAHFQHLYWRNMEPDLFTVKPAADEQKAYEQAILRGYQSMDKLAARFLDMAGDDATVFLCTALSQQPCLQYEDQGGKVAYRPRDFEKLLAFAGVRAPHRVAPVMTEEFHLVFERGEDAGDAQRKLLALEAAGRPALRVELRDGALFAGCSIHVALAADARLRAEGGRSVSFFEVFYRVGGKKSGMHHPDGILWIRTPEKRHCVHADKVALTQIAPTILEMAGLPRPRHMRGASLAGLLRGKDAEPASAGGRPLCNSTLRPAIEAASRPVEDEA